jgi:hypothetical protein
MSYVIAVRGRVRYTKVNAMIQGQTEDGDIGHNQSQIIITGDFINP